MFFILYLILLFSSYVAQNTNLDEKSRIGYFAVLGIGVVVVSVISLL